MKKFFEAIVSDVAKQVYLDLVGLTGLALCCCGAYRIYEPSAAIVGGVSLMAYAFKASKA